MGRYSVSTSLQNPLNNQSQKNPIDWPKSFPKDMIGIDRNGIILKNELPIKSIEDMELVPNCLEAIRTMKLKGYKVFIFFNEPMISQGIVTTDFVDSTNQRLMEIFGQAGIMSIEGLLYSTSNFKEDIYSFPNIGMLKKAEKEFHVKFKGGYFIGDKIADLKVADNVGARPILIECGESEKTKERLKTFANKKLREKTKVFNSLLEFANSLT